MASYTKFSELTGSSQTALITAVHPAGVSNTSVVTQEYIFDEDAELDYSASFTDGMSAATVTFSELPATTKAIHVALYLNETATSISFRWKRTSGGTNTFLHLIDYADVGTNALDTLLWMPTGGNSIYVTTVDADSAITFKILGYKTGA